MANYLYNGIELPQLPEWDTEIYPYAVIVRFTSAYMLAFLATPIRVQHDGSTTNRFGGVAHIAYKSLEGEEWVELENSTATIPVWVKWANYDVYYYYDSTDILYPELAGVVYLAASDPIPVNPATTLDPTALLMCWQVGNRIRQRGGA